LSASTVIEEKHLGSALHLTVEGRNKGGETKLWVSSAKPEALGSTIYPFF
jgi:hypothetical protein